MNLEDIKIESYSSRPHMIVDSHDSVRMTHKPTGVHVVAEGHKSLFIAKNKALKMLDECVQRHMGKDDKFTATVSIPESCMTPDAQLWMKEMIAKKKPRPVNLLKLKHLFFASYTGKISYLNVLKMVGLTTCPESMESLRDLRLTENGVNLIDTLYNAQRRIEAIDPLPYIPLDLAMRVRVLGDSLKSAGVSISDI